MAGQRRPESGKYRQSGIEGTGIVIRLMEKADLEAGLTLSGAVGWNQLLDDWELFYGLNPGGAFVAEHDGRVVGTVTTTDYGGKMGWVSMVIVDPAYRHRGIATRLVRAAIKALSHVKAVKLDATPSGRKVYACMGFIEEFSLTRYSAEKLSFDSVPVFDGTVRPMAEADLPVVAEKDAIVLGADRRQVIEGLFAMAPEYAFVWELDGVLEGFALGRHGADFEFIGPLSATDISGARALCYAVLERTAGRSAGMDIPNSAVEWRRHMEDLGMCARRPFTRMYLGNRPLSGETGLMFAAAGPELG